MAEKLSPGQMVEWNSSLFGGLSGVVQKVLEDRFIIVVHPLTGEPASIPIDWVVQIRDGGGKG